MSRYLETRHHTSPNDPLFLTEDGKPLTSSRFASKFKQLNSAGSAASIQMCTHLNHSGSAQQPQQRLKCQPSLSKRWAVLTGGPEGWSLTVTQKTVDLGQPRSPLRHFSQLQNYKDCAGLRNPPPPLTHLMLVPHTVAVEGGEVQQVEEGRAEDLGGRILTLKVRGDFKGYMNSEMK